MTSGHAGRPGRHLALTAADSAQGFVATSLDTAVDAGQQVAVVESGGQTGFSTGGPTTAPTTVGTATAGESTGGDLGARGGGRQRLVALRYCALARGTKISRIAIDQITV